MVCFDESPTQLIGEVREPIPAAPGQPERYDYEYKRNGFCTNTSPGAADWWQDDKCKRLLAERGLPSPMRQSRHWCRKFGQSFANPVRRRLAAIAFRRSCTRIFRLAPHWSAATPIMLNTLDPDEHLIQAPLVSWPWSTASQTVGKALAKFAIPAPHRLRARSTG